MKKVKYPTLKEVYVNEIISFSFKNEINDFRLRVREELTAWGNLYTGSFASAPMDQLVDRLQSSIKDEMKAAFEKEVRSVLRSSEKERRPILRRRAESLRRSLNTFLEEL